MAKFADLPSEILLKVISTLWIPDIHAFGLACKYFDAIIKENSSAVYRVAAILHGYVYPSSFSSSVALLEHAARSLCGSKSRFTVSSWLEYCMSSSRSCDARSLTFRIGYCTLPGKVRWRIDRAWGKPSFPHEVVNFCSNNDSFTRICQEGNMILLSHDNRSRFSATI